MIRPKISLNICVWSSAEHLFWRSLETWARQDFPKDDWEMNIALDNNHGHTEELIDKFRDRINIGTVVRYTHNYGMRGNCVSFNTLFMSSRGDILAESTPEILVQPNVIRLLYELHEGIDNRFVAMKTYNLELAMQEKLDMVDWKSDIMNISKLEGWNSEWVQQNVKKDKFRTHQICSIRKDSFYRITKGFGFPIYSGYGEEDPFYSGLRERSGIEDYVEMKTMPIHQWHLNFNYFASLGYAPMLNKDNHTTSNYMNDVTGEVPSNGTCGIFDHGKTETQSEEEKKKYREYDGAFIRTGGNPIVLIPK